MDPQWDPSERWDINWDLLLPHVDLFMPNISELLALTGSTDLQAALNHLKPYANVIVVKNGSEGAYVWDGKTLIQQKPFLNREVVDAIGAGDSFNSGFIYMYLRSAPLSECLEFGALMGAINTTGSGGTEAFENLDRIKTIAKSNFDYTFK
jgi:sugar/nucleoside kinase (ribokinase family)